MKVKESIRKPAPVPKDVSDLVERITSASEEELVVVLRTFPRWQFSRGDLHAWTPVLDRFDALLEDIVKSYDLTKLQTNDFTPKTRQLLLEILRVHRILLENCTNRKLFASYDRLADLLLTSDIDVLASAIFVLLRPAQQYGPQMPLDSPHRQVILGRLQTLCRGWEIFAHAGLDLTSSLRATLPEDIRRVEIQYYPTVTVQSPHNPVTTPSRPPTTKQPKPAGPSTLDLGDVTQISSSVADRIAQLAETHHIPLQDQFVAWNRARLVISDDRESLLTTRLLSLATYVCIASEDTAQSTIFLYEPDLIAQLGGLLLTTSDTVRTAALLALDACVHHRAKTNEIMTALCSNVNHGLIITHLRGLVDRLVNGDPVSHELVDATMAIVAFISTYANYINLLMGAGLLRILLDMCGTVGPRRDTYVPRATGLIDSIVFSTPQGLSNFSNIDGVNTLVHRVKVEIESPPASSHDMSAVIMANNPLKGVLRCLHRLMQASGGTEGLRNLVDSDLPKSLKRIFEEPTRYGPRVYALAINIMATFVHNEPTSLSILQDLQLPQTLYAQLEQSIPAYHEVIATVPSAIGAICLNRTGLEYTLSHQSVIINLVNAAMAPPELVNDRDNVRHLGSALDELGRHQPGLRPIIMRGIIEVLRAASHEGALFVPSTDERQDYLLEEMAVQERPKTPSTNKSLATFTRIFKVLGGLLRSVTTTKDFIDQGGLPYLFGIADLPCLPIRFGVTDTAVSLAHLLKYIAEYQHAALVDFMVESIHNDMRSCPLDDASWLALHNGSADADVRARFKILRGLAIRLTFFSDALFTLSFSHARIASSLVKSLTSIQLSDLGRIHRACIRQHIALVVDKEAEAPAPETGAKFLATRLHTVLTKYFTCVIRLIFAKRNTDTAVIVETNALADNVARVLVEHLQQIEPSAASDTVALGVVTSLLFDNRGVEGHLNTTVFLAFITQDGLPTLTTAITRIIDRIDVDATAETVASLKVALSLLCALSSPKSLLEGTESRALETRPQSRFVATDCFVIVRQAIFPLVYRVWQAPWLLTCPVPTIKLAVRAFTTLMQGRSEEQRVEPPVNDSAAPAPVTAAPRQPLVADPAAVDQLVDMGFARRPSERALLRARNNVAAATEYMLSMPHVFQGPDTPTNEGPDPAPHVEATEAPGEAPEPPAAPTAPMIDPAAASAARQSLQQLRAGISDTAERAFVLLDHAEDLVFELLPCFLPGEQGVTILIDRLDNTTASYQPEQAQTLSALLRLVTVHLRSAEDYSPTLSIIEKAAGVLSRLPLDQKPRPPWFPAFFLFSEVIFASSLTVIKAKIGDDAQAPVTMPTPTLDQTRARLATACTQVISDQPSRDELMAALRLLVLLSRSGDTSIDVASLLMPFKQSPADKMAGCHAYLAVILRHTFEDTDTLTSVMRREIHEWFSPSRGKVSDINHFTRQFRQAASRSPTCFVNAVEQECALVDPTPPQSVYHIRNKDKMIVPAPPSPDPFRETASENHSVVDHILSELSEATQMTLKLSSDVSDEEVAQAYRYTAVLMSLLTELLGSYLSVKKAMLASAKQLVVKARGLPAIVNDLVCCVVLDPDVKLAEQRRGGAGSLAISSWASSMIVALCSDTASHEDLTHIRKTVLDVIAKSIRETSSYPDPNIRYGRLWALGELVYRLLSARSKTADRSVQIAKIMLEKNFVSLFTSALGEMDLNYPDVRSVLVSLLRSLDHLSKLSVKWGKVNKPKDQVSEHSDEEEGSTTDESESDVDMLEEDHMAPDLYRNSALGMIGGELGDDDDEDDEDDEDEDDEDMDMDDEGTDDEDGTQSSGDESLEDALEQAEWEEEMAEEELSDTGEELDPEVLLGSADEEDWEDAANDHPSLTTDEQEAIDEEDDEQGAFLYDDEDEAADMEMDEEEDFDEIDMLDTLPHGEPSSDIMGPWGWDQGTELPRHRSVLFDDPAASLFGAPPRSAQATAQHPLIANPSALPATPQQTRGWPRSLGSSYSDLLTALNGMAGSEAVRVLESMIADRRLAGRDAVAIEITHDVHGNVGLSIGGRSFNFHHETQSSRPAAADATTADFVPLPTMQRWQDESSLFLSAQTNELATRIVVHIINRLMPEARRRAEDEEKEEKKRQEQADRVAAKAAEEQMASAIGVALPESRQPSPEPTPPDHGNEDVLMVAVDDNASLARTIISIHGREVDITDTGIDLEFLQALPDDMRADVVEQHMREQNRIRRPTAAADAPEPASQINPEFLDALPPEIRAEVIMQEAMENARRASPAQAPVAPDAAPAGFFASLPDELRDVMLQGQPIGGLGVLPPPGDASRSTTADRHREALQVLDKPGLASLVRLLFFPDTLKKGHLFKVLVNLCENSASRADLLNLLLSVVQDGSGDLQSADRSFQQMSIRTPALTPKPTPKTQTFDSPAAVPSTGLFAHLQIEHVPTFITQRCFEALLYIVNSNGKAASYFLQENEQPIGGRRPPSRKGKGKEKVVPQTSFPIVTLLGLLDRPLFAKSAILMENITALLVTITKPLVEQKFDSPPRPLIPANVLRLIVNCLTCGECNSRTFRQTLLVMQNLSSIPDAKEVILQELHAQCRELGATVQTELDDLALALQSSDKDIDSSILGQLSSPTAKQAQMLRLLKTIDYLHLNESNPDRVSGEMTDAENAVSAVFDSFDFSSLWSQLGQCLAKVEDRGNTEQLATVLLPLVEALMVVCKYRERSARSSSMPPTNAVDGGDLFVSFTTTHRKVLNTIVRNNPSLLSGSFSLLIRNPRVLEFDNKRNWFFQKLKRKRDPTLPPDVLRLNIRRQYVFDDSFRALQRKTGDEIKYGKLSVKFYNEDGVDAGGVTREWYSVLAQQIFDPNFVLFEPCAADKQTYQPNKMSSVNAEHLTYFKFVGRIIGKAVYDGRLLDAYFNRAFYKQILGRTVDMRDLESIDPEYHKSLQWMLDNDITGVIDQEFTIEDDQFGAKKIVELKQDGASIPVTEDNKEEYVRLVVSYRLDNSIKDQIMAFLDGFYDIIPREYIQIFEPDQLELLISGITTVDVDELKNATQLSGWKTTDPEIAWFWRALRSFSQEERSRFLMFVTSSSRVPLGGFTQLQGSSGIQPFQIQKLYAPEGSLPQASTCFNLLLLPSYASYEQLRDRLQFAIMETGGFGKA